MLTTFRESREFMMLSDQRNATNLEAAVAMFEDLFLQWQVFKNEIQKDEIGPMATFRQSFIDMIQILHDFIKSIRLGDWDLHLQSTERMLVWMHAYDRINYSRHFTYYWADQQKLQTNHPSIYHEFQQGNFSVKRCQGKFNMLPSDQVIEQTINRDQKGPGGIIGISTSTGSIQRWVLSSHNTATLAADFKRSLGLGILNTTTKDLGTSRKQFDEKATNLCYETISTWNNPFLTSSSIVSLSSGVTASVKIQSDLLKAKEVGEKCLEHFLKARIETNSV